MSSGGATRRLPATLGLLYPGEMGCALAAALAARGAHLVTTLQGRSRRSAARCRAAGITEVNSLADVVRAADVVISAVPPAAAEAVAEQYAELAHLAPPRALFVDANSVRPELVEALAVKLARRGIGFVDAAVNGLAGNLTSGATLFLSGPRAAEVVDLFDGTVAVRLLGEEVGRASAIKMLLSGVSKGACALLLEVYLLAERRGMLDEAVEAMAGIYPGLAALAERMLPTYARHAVRRAQEMREVEATARSSGLEPCVLEAVADVHHALAAISLDADGGEDGEGGGGNGSGQLRAFVRRLASERAGRPDPTPERR